MKTLKRKLKIEGCCDNFNYHINTDCIVHPNFTCPDNPIRFYTTFQNKPSFGIPHFDGISYIEIYYCPWCGQSLEPIAKNAVKK